MAAYMSIVIPVKSELEVQLTHRCVQSIFTNHAQTIPMMELLLVNYGNVDLTDLLNKRIDFPQKVILRTPEVNINQAFNLGMKNSTGTNVFLVENDVYFIEPSFLILSNLMMVIKAGVVAPLILYPNRVIERAGVIYKKLNPSDPGWYAPHWRFQRSSFIDAVTLSSRLVAEKCVGISREVINHVGYLDEQLSFLYACIDYCLKAHKRGEITYHVGYTSVITDAPQWLDVDENYRPEYVAELSEAEDHDRLTIYKRWNNVKPGPHAKDR